MAGTLRTLGLHVPQPEVVADATNPQGVRRAALGRRPARRAARAQQRPGLRRPAPRVARHRHDQRRPRHPRARHRVAGAAVRPGRRARHQGPPCRLVPRPVARGCRPLRCHVVVRHHASAGHRGRRLQADLLREGWAPAPTRAPSRAPPRGSTSCSTPSGPPAASSGRSSTTATCSRTGRSRCSRSGRPSTSPR